MRIRLTVQRIQLGAELRSYVTRRIHFGLGRFAEKVRRLSIRLSDTNGPRGGLDKCCEIRVQTVLPRQVIVEERQASIHVAVARAVERAARSVQRQLHWANVAGRRPALGRRKVLFGE